MSSKVTQTVLSEVKTRQEAEEVVSKLLEYWVSETAFDRILEDAKRTKKTSSQVLKRRVANLFKSFSPYRL